MRREGLLGSTAQGGLSAGKLAPPAETSVPDGTAVISSKRSAGKGSRRDGAEEERPAALRGPDGRCRLPAELPTCPGSHPTQTEGSTQTDAPATGPHREGHTRVRSDRKRWRP